MTTQEEATYSLEEANRLIHRIAEIREELKRLETELRERQEELNRLRQSGRTAIQREEV